MRIFCGFFRLFVWRKNDNSPFALGPGTAVKDGFPAWRLTDVTVSGKLVHRMRFRQPGQYWYCASIRRHMCLRGWGGGSRSRIKPRARTPTRSTPDRYGFLFFFCRSKISLIRCCPIFRWYCRIAVKPHAVDGRNREWTGRRATGCWSPWSWSVRHKITIFMIILRRYYMSRSVSRCYDTGRIRPHTDKIT